MSLKTREFTHTAVFSGMSTREILVREHLPYVMPIVFSTTMNNMNWSIGLEVTLSVLGFTDINSPTIGGMIYWANQHTAMVAGVWWWIAFPVILIVMLFIGLFLLAVSMNEHIDPRSRLQRINEDRNPGLVAGIAAIHESGQRVFAAVGSLHTIGPHGVAALLAQRGYQIEFVPFGPGG
jgi:peptide/nickel transport system permease protein